MAEETGNDDAQQGDELLIAEVKAYFIDGEAVDLLPFKHETDVRAEVNKFIEEWVKTGFLLQGPFLYPWHQVKMVEVVSVQALTHAQAAPYLENWRQDTEAQKAFWKTRKAAGAKDGSKEEKKS